MGLFRRKAQVVDAEHLLQEMPTTGAPDPLTPGGVSADFRLTVQDIFSIKGRGTVVTGQIESGTVSVGSTVAQSRQGQLVRRVQVTGVEMFRKKLDTAKAGDNVGLLLDSVGRDDLAGGDVLSA
jgi:elongation factor Tu